DDRVANGPRGVERLAAADAVNVDVEPGLGEVVEAEVDEVVAVVPQDVDVDVGVGEEVGWLTVGLGGVEGEVVLSCAQVRPHVQALAGEGLRACNGEGQLVHLTVQLQVEVGEQVIEDLHPAVGDHGGGGGHGVVGDRHRVGLAGGDHA